MSKSQKRVPIWTDEKTRDDLKIESVKAKTPMGKFIKFLLRFYKKHRPRK